VREPDEATKRGFILYIERVKIVAQLNVSIDDKLMEQGEFLFNSLGLGIETAICVFISQSIREGGLPFPLTLKADPFYSSTNMRTLDKSIEELRQGKVVAKSIEELEAMENE
jgi:DNA-damage-inducible protein J